MPVLAGATPPLTGPARVIDGDTLALGAVTVRVHGIDAPERRQTCGGAGRGWPCGDWAREVLEGLIDGRSVTCIAVDTDRHGRMVGRCSAGQDDLAAGMVLAGAALAYRRYSMDHVAAEDTARRAGRGLWQADGVQRPEDWRAATAPAPQAPPGDCVLKGNISASGRIYHRPGQHDYERTRIDPARGERWFCSEAEALAAGWRPAAR